MHYVRFSPVPSPSSLLWFMIRRCPRLFLPLCERFTHLFLCAHAKSSHRRRRGRPLPPSPRDTIAMLSGVWCFVFGWFGSCVREHIAALSMCTLAHRDQRACGPRERACRAGHTYECSKRARFDALCAAMRYVLCVRPRVFVLMGSVDSSQYIMGNCVVDNASLSVIHAGLVRHHIEFHVRACVCKYGLCA